MASYNWVSASAVARYLNGQFGRDVFVAQHGDLPQTKGVVFVSGPPARMQEAFSFLRGKGLRLEFTGTGRMLRVVGKNPRDI